MSLVAGLVVSSGRESRGDSLRCLDLGGMWKVAQAGNGDEIAAKVPGCIHTDLLSAGKIPDPFYGDNEHTVQWVSDAAWVYHRSFAVDNSLLQREHVLLHCEGLDTLATIKVNGREIARTDNMFRLYEFDVKGSLQPGDNTIEIRFDPVVPFVRARKPSESCPLGRIPALPTFARSPATSAGTGAPRSSPAASGRRSLWWPSTRPAGRRGHRPGPFSEGAGHAGSRRWGWPHNRRRVLQAEVSVSFGTQQIGRQVINLDKGRGRAQIVVAKAKLWWPSGMGGQPLYVVKVELRRKRASLGFLDQTHRPAHLAGRAANQDLAPAFCRNGVPFFAKGANWIPADCFANRITRPILQRYMDDAVAANMNTLRLWGGGYYEEDELYDLCDQRGMCLWVDLKFGCTTYPAFDEAFLANVPKRSATICTACGTIPRLPCGAATTRSCSSAARTWTKDKMSAPTITRCSATCWAARCRAGAAGATTSPVRPTAATSTIWEVWHGGKPFEVYRDIHGFVSEFGFQSFPEPKTVTPSPRPRTGNRSIRP